MSDSQLVRAITRPDALPPHIAAVLASGWDTARSTAGAVHRSTFNATSITDRKKDLQKALDVLESIELAKSNSSSLCRLLLVKLPLELRGSIYEYIVPGRSVSVLDPEQRQREF